MALVVNTNIPALNALRNLERSQGAIEVAMQRLSSGLRINSAKDDAAGLAIATRMSTQVIGLNVGIRNANDGTSVTQVADGVLSETVDSLQRIRELALQAMSGQYAATDINSMQVEVNALVDEIKMSAQQTSFNRINLFDGRFSANFNVSYTASPVAINLSIGDMNINATNMGAIAYATSDSSGNYVAPGLGLIEDISTDITTSRGYKGLYSLMPTPDVIDPVTGAVVAGGSNASNTIAIVDGTLSYINSQRSVIGAKANQFDAVINNLETVVVNTTAARSRIMDADYAIETANLTKAMIIQQAGISVLSQAEILPERVLQLLA